MVFRRLLGGRGWDEQRKRGEQLYEAGDLSGAKQAFERAFAKAPDDAARADLRDAIDRCRDGLAERRLAEADRLDRNHAYELAREELFSALDVASSAALKETIEARLDTLERHDARDHAPPSEELDDDQLFELVSARWEEEQSEELLDYGEPLRKAVVALQKGEGKVAHELLESIIATAEIPRYVRLELARAQVLLEEPRAAEETLIAFLDTLDDDEGGEARLAAHFELARLRAERGDDEGAMDQYQAAIAAVEDDYRPLAAMGSFLRTKGRYAEAVEIFEEAATLVGTTRPDSWLLEELALALEGAGRRDDAIRTLEHVITVHTSRGLTDFPVRATTALATMYEENGNLERAADLMASLTRGSDRAGQALYHRETGRLLLAIGLEDEARRMLQRATALCEGDADERARIDELLARLKSASGDA